MQRQDYSQATSTLGNTPNLHIGFQTNGKPYKSCANFTAAQFVAKCHISGVMRAAQCPGGESLGRRRKVPAMSQAFSSLQYILSKDLRFKCGGAKLVSCPGCNLTSVSPFITPWTLRKNPTFGACTWVNILSVITQDSWPYVRIGTKTDLKTDSFAVFESSVFLTTER